MQFSPQQARDAFNKLSEKVQTYVTSDAVTTATERIAESFQLQNETRAKFSYIIGTVLLKLVETEILAETLATELVVPLEKAVAIAEQAQKEIFARIPSETAPSEKKVEPFSAKVQPLAPPITTAPQANAGATDEKNLRALFRISVGTNYTEDALREKFETLPQGLRQAIASVDTANAVQTIAKKYLLHVDQMGALSSETGLVLLGLTHPRDFTKNLSARLRISEQRALEIAKSVSEAVLIKVKETLRGLHEVKPAEKKVEPFGKTKVQPLESPKKLGVLSAQTETPLTAKWNTGEEKLSREEVLRGVENPKEIIGPTGWKPSIPKPPTPSLPIQHPSLPPPTPPQIQKPKSVLDEKLTQTVSLPREERKYSVDPYREPLQ